MNAIVIINDRATGPATYLGLENKIRTKQAKVGVMGLGHVGLPLGLAFCDAGFDVTGLDIDTNRVASICDARPHADVATRRLQDALRDKRFKPTSNLLEIGLLDAISICVPTPQRKTKDPDMSYIISAADAVARQLRPGQLIIVESASYPGATEEIVLPVLSASGLRVGEDFFLACSPERLDPGNISFNIANTPKVIGGITPRCVEVAAMLYGTAVKDVVKVSSARSAEMVKLLENTFRSVNMALVNEMALVCSQMKLDIWEVIHAASSKPFGFMPFYPGPGFGGRSIPVDPVYLGWKAKTGYLDSPFISLADKINSGMPRFVVARAQDLLDGCGVRMRNSRIHILGVTYKKDISDSRESPAIEVIKLLMALGARLSYSDPFVPTLNVLGKKFESTPPTTNTLGACDLAIIITDHSAFDYPEIIRNARLVFDTRNATNGFMANNVVRL